MLLDDIITILSDQNGSLESALLKTKILMRKLGHKELVGWVNAELTGYEANADVPTYRHVHSSPHGHVVLNGWQYKDTLLPLSTLKEGIRKNVTEINISSSIGTIEEQVKTYRKNNTGLVRQLTPDYMPALAKGLAPGAAILAAWCEINMAEVEAILVQVRSRLLDFCLELQEQLGDATEQELPEKAASIDTLRLFQTIVYGGTVIVGSSKIQVTNKQGDIDGLLKEIGKLGFDQEDLEELRAAVKADHKPDVTEGETSKWYMKALKKAKDGVIDFGADVVTKVMVEALKHYAGTP
jgi:AbiTii